MAQLVGDPADHGAVAARAEPERQRNRSPRHNSRTRYGRLRKRRVNTDDDIFTVPSSPGPRSQSHPFVVPSKSGDGRPVGHNKYEKEGDHVERLKDVTVAIDLGTNNSIVAVQLPGEEKAYVATYPDIPDLLDSAPLVPSRVQYDKEGNLIRYGHQVGADEEGVIQWFKLMLAADDYSSVRTKVEEVILKGGLNEDAIITDFLGKIFEAVRTHLPDPAPAQYVDAYSLDILAAQPSQSDELGKVRYVACLRSAAAQAGLRVRSVHIFSESRAVARSSIVKFDKAGHYLYCVHDGGGGTTHLQVDWVTVNADSSTQREELHAPHYLSRGGEDTNVLYEKYLRTRYLNLTEVQMAACMRLWKTVVKVKHPDSWSLDSEAKALLPTDFVCNDQFRREMNEHVFDPVLNDIISYLVEGFHQGTNIAVQRHPELLEQGQEGVGHPPQTIWDLESDETQGSVPRQPESSEEHESSMKYETMFVSSGGQSADFRLQKKLQEHFSPHWRRARNPRTGVVDGLLLLHTDRQEHPQEGAWARCAYGYIGWAEADSSDGPGVGYNEDLKIFERRTPSYIIHPGDDISIGSVHRLPGRETCAIGQVPEWPEEIVIRQFSQADVDAWTTHRELPRRARRILTLTPPERRVAEELVVLCHHSKDKTSGPLDYCAVHYQVRLMVMRDRLKGQIVVPSEKDDVIVTQTERPFHEIGLRSDL